MISWLVEKVKGSLKRIPGSIRAVRFVHFLASIPLRQWTHPRKIWFFLRIWPHTLISTYPRLNRLQTAVEIVEREGIDGDIVEFGVWNGGSAAVLASPILPHSKREVWLFDSWEGMPEPTELDVSCWGQQGQRGQTQSSFERAQWLLHERMGLDPGRVHMIKGWFEETLPERGEAIERVAVLHIDCDWYQSVRYCLEEMFDRVVPGGFIVLDDYGHWHGCRVAVDEFLAREAPTVRLKWIDETGVYFRKAGKLSN